MLRRHGITNTAPEVAEDVELSGIMMRAGDAILPLSLLVGLDDRVNPDPLRVDFEREKPVHSVFGNGPHACPGAILARRELRVFIEEWLLRTPDFRIAPGTTPLLATGRSTASCGWISAGRCERQISADCRAGEPSIHQVRL